MLTTLRIKNLALVADLTLELAPGLNVITGETGAGKSVILGALNLVLGQRADRTLIRTGADACTVEASFDTSRLQMSVAPFLAEHGLEASDDGQLVIKRTFTAAGTNRQFINGSATQLGTLAALGDGLVDLHGPHEHQSLLQSARQLAILDAFGGLAECRASVTGPLARRRDMERARAELTIDERSFAQQLDLLRFQVREITEARLREGEDAEIEKEHRRATHAARLQELAQTSLGLLTDRDDAVLAQLGAVGRLLQDMQRLDAGAAAFVGIQEQAMATLRELQADLSRYADQMELDPSTVQRLEERLNLLQSLKRKYGHSLPEVLAFGAEAQSRLATLEGRDAELIRLNQELAELDRTVRSAGEVLSAERRKLIPKLSKAVARELAALGFRQSSFLVTLIREETPSATGFDTCEFQFAPNPGEPARPLRAIASSGELARVMLALKTVLAAEDEVPVLVFDEVDANVGGETATAVGAKLRQIARQHQVVCITHLAPVAAAGDAHFVVTKEVVGGRTESHVERLDRGERIEELARMLGGVSAVSRQHAEELLGTKA
ncbi:MAG TPA: DNA repair protein RecN [Verrucomicrobiota bacterium]|nr:DNA repair protein RecN [Verrucomicrobiales bacterium]HRI13585.1 DNA repair protein RecN [Verrucomicrobiota bacterium]